MPIRLPSFLTFRQDTSTSELARPRRRHGAAGSRSFCSGPGVPGAPRGWGGRSAGPRHLHAR
eukprot:9469068-Pyramimonas_sp.AAC.1